MMLGWAACSHGARMFHRWQPVRGVTRGRVNAPVFTVFVAPVLALLLAYPMVAAAHRAMGWDVPIATLLVLSGITFVAFQGLRGLGTPWARTILVTYAERERLDVPTSIVSVFNAVQKLAHTAFTALFFVVSRFLIPGGASSDTQIEFGLLLLGLVLAVGFAVGPLLAYWNRAWARRPDAPTATRVVVIGSFREDLPGLLRYCDALRAAGVEVLHPPGGADAVREVDGFVQLTTDTSSEPGEQQRRVFEFIDEAAAVVLYTPSGRAGSSSAMEIGYALRTGKPVFTTTALHDATLSGLVEPLNGLPPEKIRAHIRARQS